MEICRKSIPGCGNSRGKGSEGGVFLEEGMGGGGGGMRWGGPWGGAGCRPSRALGAGVGSLGGGKATGDTVTILLDLVLGTLRALAFDLQLYFDFPHEKYL